MNTATQTVQQPKETKWYFRPAAERGHFKNDWLEARHSFSFGQYYNPRNMGFGPLRVINQDIVQAGQGFGKHPHDNMEIITFVTNGVLRHQDTLGHEAVIKPGEIQMMSAGTGIRHSEFNDSKTEELRLLQIWIEPNKMNVQPKYEQKQIASIEKKGDLIPLASENGARGGLSIYSDAELYLVETEAAKTVSFHSERQGALFIQVVKGSVTVAGNKLTAGDALAGMYAFDSQFEVEAETRFLVFDLGQRVS